MLAGLAVTLPAAAITGEYPAFVSALLHGIDPAFAGNVGLTTIVPWAGMLVSGAAIAVALLAVRREEAGLLVAGLAGTFMGTYVGIYAPVLPASLLAAYRERRPGRALVVGAAGAVAWLALPLFAGIALLAVLADPGPERRSPDPRY